MNISPNLFGLDWAMADARTGNSRAWFCPNPQIWAVCMCIVLDRRHSRLSMYCNCSSGLILSNWSSIARRWTFFCLPIAVSLISISVDRSLAILASSAGVHSLNTGGLLSFTLNHSSSFCFFNFGWSLFFIPFQSSSVVSSSPFSSHGAILSSFFALSSQIFIATCCSYLSPSIWARAHCFGEPLKWGGHHKTNGCRQWSQNADLHSWHF